MVSPYRAGQPPTTLKCPRCSSVLPPTDVADCLSGCGTWVSQFASTEVLTDTDRRLDPVTRWWRVRAPCPQCGEQMKLYGDDPGLLQGCASHGYFVDADTTRHTGLARGVDIDAIEHKRADTERVQAEREALAEAEERERIRKEQVERAEAALRKKADAASAQARREKAADKRRLKLDELMAEGASAALAEYVIALKESVAKLERRVAELERVSDDDES